MKKQIRVCSVQLKMRDGESHWIENFFDIGLEELEEVIEEFLLAAGINKEEISQIILTR